MPSLTLKCVPARIASPFPYTKRIYSYMYRHFTIITINRWKHICAINTAIPKRPTPPMRASFTPPLTLHPSYPRFVHHVVPNRTLRLCVARTYNLLRGSPTGSSHQAASLDARRAALLHNVCWYIRHQPTHWCWTSNQCLFYTVSIYMRAGAPAGLLLAGCRDVRTVHMRPKCDT